MDDSEDIFEDAIDEENMSMKESFQHVVNLVNKYTQHEFQEVRHQCERFSNKYLVHALGLSLFDIIEAYLCLGEYIPRAAASVKHTIEFAESQRLKQSFFRHVDYSTFTEEELVAEVIYIFAHLVECGVLMLQDPSMISLISKAIKIKYFYSVIKSLKEVSKSYKWSSQYVKDNVEIVLKLMFGAFSLVLSVFPNKLIKFFNFMGFDTSEAMGLEELQEGINNENNGFLIVFLTTTLMHRSMFTHIFSYNIRDLEICKKLVETQVQSYPEFFLTYFFQGRIQLLSGKFNEAIDYYIKSWKCQEIYPQLHSICYWELLFTSIICRNYRDAYEYIEKLLESSKWSLTGFHYYKAIIMMHLNLPKEKIEEEMKLVPLHRKKVMFRTVYNEKILIYRAERYLNHGKLFLPALELLFIYNVLKIACANEDESQKWLAEVEREMGLIENDELKYDFECAGYFYKGILLRALGAPLQAEKSFNQALQLEKNVKEDTFLLPFTCFEQAVLAKEQKNFNEARNYMEKVKKYSGFSRRFVLNYSLRWLKRDLDEVEVELS